MKIGEAGETGETEEIGETEETGEAGEAGEIGEKYKLKLKYMKSYKRFEDLEIWKEGMDICKEIYILLNDCKDYGLKDQMQRASVSIPSNIAEGYERNGLKEKQQYMFIAKASCGEIRTQLYLAVFLNYIDPEKGNILINRVSKLSIMIYNYIQFINKQ